MSNYKTLSEFEQDAKQVMGSSWSEVEIHSQLVADIISARIDQRLSQEDVATATGQKQSAIARFENCNGSPRLDTIIKILVALDLEIEIKKKEAQPQKIFKLADRYITRNFSDYVPRDIASSCIAMDKGQLQFCGM